jgi:hypothetical protein
MRGKDGARDNEREAILPTNDLMFLKLMTSRGHESVPAGFVRDFYAADVAPSDIRIEDPVEGRIEGVEETLRLIEQGYTPAQIRSIEMQKTTPGA